MLGDPARELKAGGGAWAGGGAHWLGKEVRGGGAWNEGLGTEPVHLNETSVWDRASARGGIRGGSAGGTYPSDGWRWKTGWGWS